MGKRKPPDLHRIARAAVREAGFEPDFPAEAARGLEGLEDVGARAAADPQVRDLRGLLWSSIDNKESRDLDQVEFVERAGGGKRHRIAAGQGT